MDKSAKQTVADIESQSFKVIHVDFYQFDDFFKPVMDSCTLCDICFVNKCPYVPPHSFNIDFPHLMLRHRIVEKKKLQNKPLPPSKVKVIPEPSLAEKFKGE